MARAAGLLRFVRRGLSLAAAALALLAAVPAPAQVSSEGPVSFEGQVIDWIVPFSEGGGSDTWARFFAPFLERHLPGHPQVNIVNEAGGGGTRGANIFTSRARPDGRTILGTSGSTQFPYLLGDFRVRYDYDDWSVLLASPTGGVVYVAADLGLSSWEQVELLHARRLVFASQGPTSLDLVPMLAFRLLGFDVNYVFGYTGRGDGLVAMQGGEVNIDYQTTPSFLRNVAPLIEQGEAVPLMSWGVIGPDGGVRRDPTFPDLPTVEEIYQFMYGHPPSGPEYETYRTFALAGFSAQKLVVLPGATPEAIRDAWIATWDRVLADPDYLARAPEVLGLYPQLVGPPAQDLARRATRIDADVRRRVHQMLAREYSVRLSE